MKIRLSPADRDKFDVTDEWLRFDPALVRVQDVIFLQSIGYRNIGELWSGLFGREVMDGNRFVYELDDDGQPLLDDQQLPIVKRGPRDQLAWVALVYLTLRRHGARVDWDTFEYSAVGFAWEPDDEGKAEPEETTTSGT